jgi:uncharacterized protein (TIGR02453 family)
MHIPALIQFLEGLAENNNRPWFLHNKPSYDILREEFTTLVAEVVQRVAKFDPEIENVDPKKCLFRIYRDVRFSANKVPYKTHFSGVIGGKTTDRSHPAYYFQINEKGVLGVGGGIYMPEPDTLQKIRHCVINQPALLNAVLKDKPLNKTYGGMSVEDRMQRPPKGYQHLPADHPHIEIIKNRHFFAFTEANIKTKIPKDLAKRIGDQYADLYPLIVWLREAVR